MTGLVGEKRRHYCMVVLREGSTALGLLHDREKTASGRGKSQNEKVIVAVTDQRALLRFPLRLFAQPRPKKKMGTEFQNAPACRMEGASFLIRPVGTKEPVTVMMYNRLSCACTAIQNSAHAELSLPNRGRIETRNQQLEMIICSTMNLAC